jgi:hypothetical protein
VSDGTQTHRATIHLRDASARDFGLTDKDVLLPMDGRGLCTFFDLKVPRDAAPGTGTLFVNDTRITTIKVMK